MELIINSKKYGQHTIYYDEADHELISNFNWHIAKGKKGVFYARARVKNKLRSEFGNSNIRMHRLIMGAKEYQEVDHIDHDGRNNIRHNLRFANKSQSTANTRVHIDSNTGFKGVTFKKKKKLYLARIRFEGELIYGGAFKNIHKAALKYNEMALEYFGEFACLNILTPEQIEDSKREMPMKPLSNNKTGYRGVSVSKKKVAKPYHVTLRVDGKNKHFGSYATAKEAALVYNKAVIEYNKPLYYLNIIPE